MRFQKSTRYALYAAVEMARSEATDPVTAVSVAERYGVPASVLAKVFQQLVRGGIAVGTRGKGGGHRLAKLPATITMLQIIELFEPRSGPGGCTFLLEDEDCETLGTCRLQGVLQEVDELVRCTFASITLETLAAKRAARAVIGRSTLR